MSWCWGWVGFKREDDVHARTRHAGQFHASLIGPPPNVASAPSVGAGVGRKGSSRHFVSLWYLGPTYAKESAGLMTAAYELALWTATECEKGTERNRASMHTFRLRLALELVAYTRGHELQHRRFPPSEQKVPEWRVRE